MTWKERLRESGHRLTPQRELVLAAVENLGHATPDEVYAEVRRHSSTVNLSTVYRTLELLDELDLIHHAHLSDRATTYHAERGHQHAHLICRRCQRTISIPREDLDPALSALERRHGFAADVGHLTIFGTCTECERAAE